MNMLRNTQSMASEYINAVIAIKEICGDDDDVLLADMIEGQTSLDSLVGSIVSQVAEDEAHAQGVVDLQKKLGERRRRIEMRANRLRVLLAQIVHELPDRSYRHALAHVRAFDVDPRVVIVDESQIPSTYWKVPEPKLDESSIRKYLIDRMKRLSVLEGVVDDTARSAMRSEVDGVAPDIPGVCLGQPELSVRIRMS